MELMCILWSVSRDMMSHDMMSHAVPAKVAECLHRGAWLSECNERMSLP